MAQDTTVAAGTSLPETHLAQLGEMAEAFVLEVRAAADDATRLKSLGLCVGRRVQLVQQGDPLILRAVGIRVGLSRRLAEQIFVEPVDAATLVRGGNAST